jgi:molybdate transport system substrate-binding protein
VRRSALTALAAALVLAGCGDGGSSQPAAATGPGAGTLTVSAAASLTDVFTELEQRFEAADPGVDVVMNFGSSSELSSQIVNGAPADVFASADTVQMAKVADAGLVAGEPQIFATNRLQIAVSPGNPDGVRSVADLTRPGLMLVVCAPQVPCGAATEEVEQAAGVTLNPVSEEPDVRSVLSKVTSGNADAGLVYRTDVLSSGNRVTGVDVPESENVVNSYPIAVLAAAARPEAARSFVELVRGAQGRGVLESAGFETP